jgi:hypothetical protein
MINAPHITLNEFVNNGIKKYGEQIFVYDSITANCQWFARNLLEASGALTPKIEKFILQDADKVIENLGFFQTLARKLTDTANVIDVAIHGGKKKAGIVYDENFDKYDRIGRIPMYKRKEF